MTVRLLLTCLSSLFIWFSFPGGPWPLLAWISLVPLGLALRGSNAAPGFGYGLLFGLLGWIGAIWGFTRGITSLYGYSMAAAWFWTGLVCLFHAMPYGIFGYLQGRFRWTEKPCGALKSSACLTLLLVWYPSVLPGNHAHAFYPFYRFIQILDLGGVPLLLFVVNLLSFLVVDVISPPGPGKRPLKSLAALITVIGLTFGYGTYRLAGIEDEMRRSGEGQWIQIASVQPNIPVAGRNHDVPLGERDNDLQSTIDLTRKVMRAHPETDLVVWPEMPLPLVCQDESTEDITALVKTIHCPLIYNCSRRAGEAHQKSYYNAAVLIRASGEPGPEYHKKILFPFGEYLPFSKVFSRLGLAAPDFMNTTHGKNPAVFDLDRDRQIIPILCYESLFTRPVREAVRSGGNVIANMTDDIRFGRSRVPVIHASLSLFRTIEYRIPMAIVTNSGDGIFAGPDGRVLNGSRMPSFKKGALSLKLFIPEKRSPYCSLGDAFLWVLSLTGFTGWTFSIIRTINDNRHANHSTERKMENEN